MTVVASNRHAELHYAELTDADAVLDGDGFVDWPLMKQEYWANTADDPDRKERRQAECLAHPWVPWELVEVVVTKTERAADVVAAHLRAERQATPVDVRPTWYF